MYEAMRRCGRGEYPCRARSREYARGSRTAAVAVRLGQAGVAGRSTGSACEQDRALLGQLGVDRLRSSGQAGDCRESW